MSAREQPVIKLSHTHDAIMSYMVANPEEKLEAVAKKFGYTQGWLSQLIHSSLFQAELHYRQDVVFGEAALGIKDRIQHLAHESLKKINERIELGSMSNDQLLDSAELALKSLGFGVAKPQGGAPTFISQTNNFAAQPIDKAILSEARAVMQQRAPLTLEHNDGREGHTSDSRVLESCEPQEAPDGGRVGEARRPVDERSVAQVGFATFGEVRKGTAAA